MITTTSSDHIKTRFLVLSDTHGLDSLPEAIPIARQHADVAIHCGDLTQGSQLDEFRSSIRLLQSLDAPLKLVIAGNHDFTMDIPVFEDKVAEFQHSDREEVVKAYGTNGQAKHLFREAGITFLDEGTHSFTLQNGARLTVYASPYTPSLGDWGFQYNPDRGRDFAILSGDGPSDIDVVITHGPPRGIFDNTHGKERAGCPDLFDAVARARPRMHCFGHIHEGWGARLVTWRNPPSEKPSHFTDIVNGKFDRIRGLPELKMLLKGHSAGNIPMGYSATSHCEGDAHRLVRGSHTLFVNASTTGGFGDSNDGTSILPIQPPWLVDLEIPLAP